MDAKIKTWTPCEPIETGTVYRPKRGRKSVEGYEMDAWAQFVEFVGWAMLPYTVREAKVTDLDVGNGTLHTFATFDGEKVVKITEFHGLRKTREGFEKGAIHAFRLDAIERR